jgi:hypothetical protein
MPDTRSSLEDGVKYMVYADLGGDEKEHQTSDSIEEKLFMRRQKAVAGLLRVTLKLFVHL